MRPKVLPDWGELSESIRSSAPAQWFNAKEPRERAVFAALAVITAAVFLWAGLWKPLSDWHAAQVYRHASASVLLEWLRANESRVRNAAEQAPEDFDRSILPLVTRSAEARGLKVGRLQPESDGVVSVTLQNQAFNDVIAWVAALEDDEGITVVRASIDAQGAPGMVNAQLRMR